MLIFVLVARITPTQALHNTIFPTTAGKHDMTNLELQGMSMCKLPEPNQQVVYWYFNNPKTHERFVIPLWPDVTVLDAKMDREGKRFFVLEGKQWAQHLGITHLDDLTGYAPFKTRKDVCELVDFETFFHDFI